jgi:enoyl-CoA hydratase/carnithine racemase
MQVAELLISPENLAEIGESWQPVGFLDLDSCPQDLELRQLPPFPLIGLGKQDHPVAHLLDAIVEPPMSAETLARQIALAPNAAAVVVQLLRSTESLPSDQALVLESQSFGLLQGSNEHATWLTAKIPETAMNSGDLFMDRDGDVLNLTFDRPWALNAIDRQLRDQLHEAFTLASLDPDIHTVTLRGNGPAFSVGADLAEFGTTRDPATAHLIRSRTLPAHLLARIANRFECHIHGGCVGSALEMAAFAHRITATKDAWFHLPELAMGIIPGAGGCVSVPRRIGRQRAALMILSGRRISAKTALNWGLIDAIVDGPTTNEGGTDKV